MMARKKVSLSRKKDDTEKKVARTGRDITEMLAMVPQDAFFSMVSKSGVPDSEKRELCQAFRELKG